MNRDAPFATDDGPVEDTAYVIMYIIKVHLPVSWISTHNRLLVGKSVHEFFRSRSGIYGNP